VGLLLLLFPRESWATSVQFRLLIGLGCVPAFLVLYFAVISPDDSKVPVEDAERPAKRRPNPLVIALRNPQYFTRLIGTGGGWFLYDISYYGTAIFTPNILASIFGKDETLPALCWHGMLVAAMAIPGTLLGLYFIRSQGARWLNIVGFVTNGLLFGALAVTYHLSDSPALGWCKFVVFCLLSLSLGFGPSIGVHVLASNSYPTAVRATFIGLSSACGKLGALIGTLMYTPIASAAGGYSAVMWLQMALSVVGMLLSIFFIESDAPSRRKQDKDSNVAYSRLEEA
jgi:hypothetical protein